MTNTLAGYMLGQFSFAQYLEFLIRILVSCACGAAIGYERTKRLKVMCMYSFLCVVRICRQSSMPALCLVFAYLISLPVFLLYTFIRPGCNTTNTS